MKIYDLSSCRLLSKEEISRCRRIADDIAQLKGNTGSGSWVAPNGSVIHGQVSKIDFENVDEDFLNRLRLHSHIFNGYRLSNLLGQTSDPHWNDALARVFDPQGIGPDWSVPAFRKYTEGLASEHIFSPPLVMGEVGFDVDGHCVNRDVVAYQERVNLMREFGVFDHLAGKNAPVILEIGAGYGGLACYLKKQFQKATYLIVDLPRSLLFSGCYLAVAVPGVDVRVFRPEESVIAPGSITLVANFLLPALPPFAVDVAVNTLSFAEMPRDTVIEYSSWLEKNLAKDGLLFEQNFDNSRLDPARFCRPSKAISRFFKCRQTKSHDLHWGVANLWSRKTRFF
jgi:putative sugar O-methyltransferase